MYEGSNYSNCVNANDTSAMVWLIEMFLRGKMCQCNKFIGGFGHFMGFVDHKKKSYPLRNVSEVKNLSKLI